MAQIETVDLEVSGESGEIRLLRVSFGRIDRKACGDDDMRAGAQEFEGGLKADLDPGAGDERIVPTETGRLFALGVVEIPARDAQRVVIAMPHCKGFLADVAGALLPVLGALVEAVRLRPLEPERRVHRRAPLYAQTRLIHDLPVVNPRGLALGAAKRLPHSRDIVALGLGDQSGEGQQFASPLRREAGEVRAIGLDRPQHADAGVYISVGERRIGKGALSVQGGVDVHGAFYVAAA